MGIYDEMYKWFQDIDSQEEKIVSKFKSMYRLNRVAGGINSENNETIRNLKLAGSKQKRNMK